MKKDIIHVLIIVSLCCIADISCKNDSPGTATDYYALALRTADYLLSQQNQDGAIPDEPGGETVNIDSNMEYALIGLAAAYKYSGDTRYLNGLEKGIHWLAAREEMIDAFWCGSWYYAFSSASPYPPVPISAGTGIEDVRGVDATCSLFVYLLYLHRTITGSDALAVQYESNAKAALDFIVSNNQSAEGFFFSSWQKLSSDGQWHLWNFRYAADQGDVYLGLRAGYLLYGAETYRQKADYLKQYTCSSFFAYSEERFATGMEDDGSHDTGMDGFDGIFPQGYLPWVFGANAETGAAYEWLKSCVQPDGSLSCYSGDPVYSLSADVYAMSAFSLALQYPVTSLNWLEYTTYDHDDGGVIDISDPDSEKYSNVQGFTIIALLKFFPML